MPTQPVATTVSAELASPISFAIAPAVLDDLWRVCEAEACGLSRSEFEQIVLCVGMAQNFGLASGLAAEATSIEQATFFATLRMPDLVLARACAAGNDRAWERFIALYRQPLLRAAIAITGNESLGRELADGLYAELYGLTEREGQRRSPLDSYSGRGSLIGWLRTTLAQRHVDRYRRTYREQPLEEGNDGPTSLPETQPEPDEKAIPMLAAAVKEALEREGPEERFLLASYYLDGRRLHQIAAVLGVHEATVSRKLQRVTRSIRKQIVRGLEQRGMKRREAEEALTTDPRDLTGAEDNRGSPERQPGYVKLKELLQSSYPGSFKEQGDSTQSP